MSRVLIVTLHGYYKFSLPAEAVALLKHLQPLDYEYQTKTYAPNDETVEFAYVSADSIVPKKAPVTAPAPTPVVVDPAPASTLLQVSTDKSIDFTPPPLREFVDEFRDEEPA